MPISRPATGLAAIALAIAFNIPFSILASTFSYPDILRRPAAEVLGLFSAGGSPLVLTWYAFMLVALALVPMSVALAITPQRLLTSPGRVVGAAICGGTSASVMLLVRARTVIRSIMFSTSRISAGE